MTLFPAQSEWSHVVVWIASFLTLPPVLLAADSVASTVVVDQPSAGVSKEDPHLVMAALVSGSNAENIAIDFELAVTAYLPLSVCVLWLDESTLDPTAAKSRAGLADSCWRTLPRSCCRAVGHRRFSPE